MFLGVRFEVMGLQVAGEFDDWNGYREGRVVQDRDNDFLEFGLFEMIRFSFFCRVRNVKFLYEMFVVQLVIAVQLDQLYNFYQLAESDTNSYLSQYIFELSLINKPLVLFVIKSKPIQQIVFINLVFNHFSLDPTQELFLPFLVNRNNLFVGFKSWGRQV